MIIGVIDRLQLTFLCDMPASIYVRISKSITAARNCDFKSMRDMANELNIRVLCFNKKGPVLVMGWDEVTYLMVVMIDAATDKVTRQAANEINAIVEALTCAVEMGIGT
uniref:Uncharacterized protein n=1 Tax=viral metagenome TaxID=1070528 RepID=A0A6M3KNP3_9ZZZZ